MEFYRGIRNAFLLAIPCWIIIIALLVHYLAN